MDPVTRPVLAALQARGVTHAVLENATAAAKRSGRPLSAVLVDDQLVTESELAEAIADAYGLDVVDGSNAVLDPTVVALLPLQLARKHAMVPLTVSDGTLTLAIGDPGNVFALDDARAATGLRLKPVVVTGSDLNRLLDAMARASTDLDEAAKLAVEDTSSTPATIQVEEDAEAAPVVRYVNSLLDRAITARGSDIHVEPSADDLRVRIRIDGVLHEVDTVPRRLQGALISRLKIMSGLDITERRVPQNGRVSVQLGNRAVDLRTATLPTVWGEKVVLRILDTGGIDLDLRKLGFSEHNYERFAAAFRRPHGMVLVTGPTGSGKSTTLYATLAEIARSEINVITVEDPVEYRIAGINQIQVNVKAGLTFAAVLPAILRSDPDVVLVGEIRDRITAQFAIEAALTGHLVLSTLHTNDAPSAVTRLVEMGIEPFLVGSSVAAVMAQRLVRRLCEWCKEPYEPTEKELAVAHWAFDELGEPAQLWRAVGCRSCTHTGYRGRLAVCEVMPVSEEAQRLTVSHASASDLARVARAEGMVPLRVDGLAKAAQGVTTLDEVLRVTA